MREVTTSRLSAESQIRALPRIPTEGERKSRAAQQLVHGDASDQAPPFAEWRKVLESEAKLGRPLYGV